MIYFIHVYIILYIIFSRHFIISLFSVYVNNYFYLLLDSKKGTFYSPSLF